ncbi:MAG: T9SS type A sorting domain-containing protein, partial [Bacteroidales bacterium]|nr:T9SS type A sorting domain-containing protein [Bacteroidales bacterium]
VTTWTRANGTTEPGSSGAALFNKDKRIVGQLYAGSSSCVAVAHDDSQEGPGGEDFFGKLSNSWTNNNSSSNSRKLKPWLDPNNTNATTLDGRWLNSSSNIVSRQNESNLNVYPNPSNGMINISGSYNAGEGICNVYDMTGKLVSTESVNLNSENMLNLTNLAPGMYTLEIFDNNDIYRSKILITK